MAAAYTKAQRLGTISDGLQFDSAAFNQLTRALADRPPGELANLEAVALRDAETPDPIGVELRWLQLNRPVKSPQRP
jgi:hypothetical protein